MNTYAKYTANVFVAKCTEQHEKGETITLETKYGKEHECIVFNLVLTKDNFFYYSIVRADGYNVQERAKARAERLLSWSASAEKKANGLMDAANEGRDFLALGEPIKVGHHSEKRHRSLIERNHNRMFKALEIEKVAEAHESKADYWKRKAKEINLSMPECIEYYEYELEKAIENHMFFKKNPDKREHSYSLTYANKKVKDLEKLLVTANKLWA